MTNQESCFLQRHKNEVFDLSNITKGALNINEPLNFDLKSNLDNHSIEDRVSVLDIISISESESKVMNRPSDLKNKIEPGISPLDVKMDIDSIQLEREDRQKQNLKY